MELLCVIWIPAFLLLLQAHSSPALDDDDYELYRNRICPHFSKAKYPSSSGGRGFTYNEELPVKAPFSRDGFTCRWETRASDDEGLGVMVVIQRLNLKRMPNTSVKDNACQDYIKFETANNPLGKTICGSVLFGMYTNDDGSLPDPPKKPLPGRPPVEQKELSVQDNPSKLDASPWDSVLTDGVFMNPEGRFSTELHISFETAIEQNFLDVTFVDIPYSECNGTDVEADSNSTLFHCGYGLCIPKGYVHDGLVNCPFGDCADETNCSLALTTSIIDNINTSDRDIGSLPAISLSTGAIIFIVILLILAFMVAIYQLSPYLPIFCERFASDKVRLQNEEEVLSSTQPPGSIYPGQIVIMPPSAQGQP